ncbi:MAG TPA: SGNH/GDSL hydrolase family protein [Aggregatilineales bacterium]|nr:SGNH/GDSL hydrolase family protein [Aggregatilineales bacterium]
MKRRLMLLLILSFLTQHPALSFKVHHVLAVGDSKTLPYPPVLVARLGAAWAEITPRLGHSGYALDGPPGRNLMAVQDADIASLSGVPDYILINIGTNDPIYPEADYAKGNYASWQAKLSAYVERWHTAFPLAHIGIAFPRRYDAVYNFAPMDRAIQVILDSHPYTFAGPHEDSFLTTHTDDGVHETEAGYLLLISQWESAVRLSTVSPAPAVQGTPAKPG